MREVSGEHNTGGLVGLTFLKPIVVGAPAAAVVVQSNASQWMADSASVSGTVRALSNTFTPAGRSHSAGYASYSQVSWQGPTSQMGSASQLWSSPATWEPPTDSGAVYTATFSAGHTSYISYADTPEPGTLALLSAGLLALGGARRWRKS